MASGTLGWKTKPSTMPIASAAIPIMPVGFPSAIPPAGIHPEGIHPERSLSRRLLSLGPNLFGELDIPDRSGGDGDAVGDVHVDADRVGDLQQPEPVQTGAVVEHVAHRVR